MKQILSILMAQIVLASKTETSANRSVTDPDTCRQEPGFADYNLPKLQNMDLELNFCFPHAGRTCCDNADTSSIRLKFEAARVRALEESSVSKECLNAVADALCYYCDADFGTARSDGLCVDYCDHLFDLCKDAFIDTSLEPQETLPFCKNDSMICSKVSTFVETPQQFCKALALPVSNRQLAKFQSVMRGLADEEPEDATDCFAGRSMIGMKYQKLARRDDDVRTSATQQKKAKQGNGIFTSEEAEDMELPGILDRLSETLFSGNGFITSSFRNMVSPGLKRIRKFNRRHRNLAGIIKFMLLLGSVLGFWQLYVTSPTIRYFTKCKCCHQKRKPTKTISASNKIPVDVRKEKIQLANRLLKEQESKARQQKQKQS